MKSLKNYIISESKSFTLTDNEREALAEFVGILCGHIENKDITDAIEVDIDKKDRLMDAYDLLEDKITYPNINHKVFKNEYKVVREYVLYADEKRLFERDPDMLDVVEKFRNSFIK